MRLRTGSEPLTGAASSALALLVVILATSRPVLAAGADANSKQKQVDQRIAARLASLGIDNDCEIVVADHQDIVEATAATTLQEYLAKGGLEIRIVREGQARSAKRFLLGRESNVKAIKDLCDRSSINIRSVSAEDDGFHLKPIGQDIVIAGANPRGVLYGVYAFEDHVEAGAGAQLDIRRIPYFRKRGSAPDYYWHPVNATTQALPEAKAAYLAHMGVNQWTDQSIVISLSQLVTSEVFTFETPPRPGFQDNIRKTGAVCKRYGIGYYPFLSEPRLPSLAGDLAKYPKEALGRVKRPWGGSEDGWDATLCVNSPVVQEHLKQQMRRFVREYPDVDGVHFYNLDSSSWLCTPGLCERCKLACKDSPPEAFNPWETQAKLVTILAEAARAERPDFDFRFWGPIHYHGEHFEKMIRAAQGFGSMSGSWTGSDRTIMVPDAAVFDPAFNLSVRTCEDRQVPFYMVYESNNLELTPRSLPFPFHACDALKKYKLWRMRYIEEGAGPVPEHNTINALVTREFQWNPDQSPEKYLAELSVKQFGQASGRLMYQAWAEMEKAFDLWDDAQSAPFTLEGSQFHLCMGTAFGLPPAIIPDVVKYYDNLLEILTNVEPWLAEGYSKYKTAEFLGRLERMNRHFSQAAEHARQAVDAASDRERIAFYYYELPEGRPTCRQYAELNYAPVAIGDALCRQRCNLIRAYILLKEIEKRKAGGEQKAAREEEAEYRELIRDDITVQERFAELLTGFAKMQPCYTRTSLTDKEIASLLANTRDKIEKLKTFLVKQKSPAP